MNNIEASCYLLHGLDEEEVENTFIGIKAKTNSTEANTQCMQPEIIKFMSQ